MIKNLTSKKFCQIVILLIMPLILSACSFTVKTKATPTGGIFKSVDAAQNWENKSAVIGVTETTSINGHNVDFLVMDPTDNNTLYAATRENGLYVSWDGANSWRSLLAGKGSLRGLVVDPTNPCFIYTATSKNVYKSLDCGRRWREVFFEKRTNANIVDIAIDPYTPSKIFLSFDTAKKGEIIWSQDAGESWQVLKSDFRYALTGLFINPKDTRIMYATTEKNIWKTNDQGLSWTLLSDKLKEQGFKNGEIVSAVVFLPDLADGIITVSKYGLLRSENGGNDWQSYILLQQPSTVNILSLAVNPANTQEMFYATDKGFYKTVDGGGNWITLSPPTNRWSKFLVIDPTQTNVLYLAAWLPAN